MREKCEYFWKKLGYAGGVGGGEENSQRELGVWRS